MLKTFPLSCNMKSNETLLLRYLNSSLDLKIAKMHKLYFDLNNKRYSLKRVENLLRYHQGQINGNILNLNGAAFQKFIENNKSAIHSLKLNINNIDREIKLKVIHVHILKSIQSINCKTNHSKIY